MPETHLSLSWDAYQKNLCSGLSLLQQRGEFVDMTLAADGHHVKVHQMVLSLVSSYIKDLISTVQCPHPVIFLNNISKTTLCSILEYIYTGEVLVPKERLRDVIAAGRALHIKGLQEMDDTGTLPNDNTSEVEDPLPMNTSLDDGLHEQTEYKRHSGKNKKECTSGNALPPIFKVFVGDDDDPAKTHIDAKDTVMNKVGDDDDPAKTHIDTKDTVMKNISIKQNEKNIKSNRNNAFQELYKNKGLSNSFNSVQYSISNQGGIQIIVNRYIYSLKYVQKKRLGFWRCADCANKKCRAILHTNEKNQIVKRKFAHNHPFHDDKIVKKLRLGTIFSTYSEAQSKTRVRKSNSNEKLGPSLPETQDNDLE